MLLHGESNVYTRYLLMYRNIETSGITTRGHSFVDLLGTHQAGHFQRFFRSFRSFFFAFLTASIFIF